MSATIDERVVEMRFDNKQFESGVKESLSTLDKLKQALNLSDSAKGLESVQKAAEGVNIGGIGTAIEGVKEKFSALEAIALGALMRIGQQAIETGERLVKSLTIEPISQGFEEYELKMGSVQTIMASTGASLETVNGYLDELNTYADKTIYSFSDMTANIGKFTNAGVKLEDAVKAIQGISNEAAVSGANANEASRAMYNFAQALSAGYVKLIDWKSIENANMATVEFKQSLLDTALAMGTVVKVGDKYQTTTTDAKGKVSELFDATSMFNDSLSAQWMTTDVLTQTLGNYATDVREMTAEEKKAYEEKLRGIGYTEDQIKSIEELGQKAFDSAQDVKTFTQLLDTLKEAVGSGWSQTFELIFGDFEEAKAMWTSVSNTIGSIIDQQSKARNELLQGWHDNGGRDALLEGLSNSWNALIKLIKPVKEAFRDIFPPTTVDQLVKITQGFRDFTKGLEISDETADKIKRTFKGVFAAADILRQGIGAVIDLLFPGVKVAGNFADGILGITASMGDWVVALDESIKKNEFFTKAVDKIREVVGLGTDKIKEFVKIIKDFVSTHFKAPDLSFITDVADTVEIRFRPLQAIFDFFSKAVKTVVDVLSKASPVIGTVASTIGKALSSFGKAIADAFTGGGFNAVLDLFNSGVLAVIGVKISEFIGSLSSITKGGRGFVDSILEIKDAVLDTFGAFQEQLKSKVLLNIATAIGILAASLVVLSLIDSEKMTESLGAITILFLDLFGSMAAFEKIMNSSGMKSMRKISGSMIVLAAAVLILASAMKKISGIDSDKLLGSLGSVSLLLGEMAGVAIILSKYGGKVKTGAVSIIAFAGAIYVLTAAVEKLGGLDMDTLIKGLTSVGVLLAELAAFMVAAKFGSLKLTQAAGIAVLAGALIILQGAVSDFGEMDTTKIVKGLTATGAILAELAVFSRVTGSADHILATSVAMIGLAAAMNLLEGPMTTFGNMSLEQIGKGLLAMGGALAEVAIAMKLMPKNSFSVGLGLIEAAAGITIISNALDSLGEMTWDEIARGLVAMGVALAEVAIAMKAMKGTLSGSAAMLVMSAALLTFVPVMKALGGMEWDEIVKGLVALGGAFTVIGVAGALLSPIVPAILGLAGAMALLGVAVAGIGVGLLAGAAGLTALAAAGVASAATIVAMLEIIVVGLLNTIRDSASALGEALKTVILTLCDVIVQCVPEIVKTVLVVVKEVLAALAENAPDIVHNLLQLIIGVIDALAADMPTVIQSVVNLFMSFFAGVTQALQGIDVSVLIEGIVGIGLLSALMLALAAMASLAPSAMVGVLAMGAVIAELAIVLAAVGALAQIPGLQWLIGEGGTLLQGIGTAIGKFIGGIVGGFVSGVSAQFPQIGTDLSNFMTNVQPFLDGASKIDPSMLQGVQALAKTILLLTAADILQGLTSWLTGGSSLAGFGEELAAFGPSFAQFAEEIKDVDPAVVAGAANAASALAEMASKLPNSGGLAGKIFGENNLSDFGAELEKFGPHLAKYGEEVKDVNPEVVEASARAAQVLADMAATLPNSGGLAAKILGDNTLSSFGEELEKFGPYLGKYGASVKDVNPEVVAASAQAAQVMADMASTLPNSGGLAAKILGDNTLSAFGEELSKFGPYIKDYSNSVSGMDPNVVVASANAAKALSELANNLPNSGGLVSWFTGDNDIADFGKSLSKFGNSMTEYYNSVSGINTSLLSNVVSEVSKLIDLANKTAGLDTSGLTGFGKALAKMGNAGIDEFIKAFTDSSSKVKSAIDTFVGYAVSAIDGSKANITRSATSIGNEVSMSFGKGITDKQASATTAVKNVGISVINALKSALPGNTFVTIGQSSIQSFITGITNKKTALTSSSSQVCQAMITQMRNSLPSNTFVTMGSNTVTNTATGIRNNNSAINAAGSLANCVISSMRNNLTYNSFYSIGSNAAGGLSGGISSRINSIANAAINAARSAVNAARNALQIHSPSRVFMDIGKNVSLGMAGGILNYISSISSASLDLANTAVDPVEMAVSTISDMVENGLDCNPVLTPVIDLSKAREGAEKIGSMYRNLDVSSTYNKALSAASGMMGNNVGTFQNGSSSMTEGLRKVMDKLASQPSQKFDNKFYITGDNPQEIAEEVSKIIQQQVERREAVWG